MAHCDEIFQSVKFPDGDRKRHYHRKPGIDRACDKVRWKNRGVPSGNDRDGEVKTYHCMYGNDEWRGQPGEQEIRSIITVPVFRRPTPSHSQNAIDNARNPVARSVSQSGEVGNQTGEPEQERNRSISRHRKHVPYEWASELRPDLHRVRIWE